MPGWEIIGEEERAAVNAVFDNGGVLFRQAFAGLRNGVYKVKEFEQAFARHAGVQYGHAVTSGTAALKVGLKGLGIGPGDEVITQSHTFVATVEAILECGATPVVADVNWTLNLDPEDLERKITERTRAVIPVHMLGVGAQMDEILAIARRHNLKVLEDTAQALGGTYHGKALGALGDVGCFSFDHGKLLTTGEGGMVLTDQHDIYFRARCYADHGHEDNPAVPRGEDTRTCAGFNYRMMELQGAIGLVQLQKLPGSLAKHRANKAMLQARVEEVTRNEEIRLREIPDPDGDNGDSVIFFLDDAARAKRVARALQEQGFGFKNLPDALNWHFAGTWDHIFGDMAPYRGRDLERDVWRQSGEILRRAIALPVFYKMDEAYVARLGTALEKALQA